MTQYKDYLTIAEDEEKEQISVEESNMVEDFVVTESEPQISMDEEKEPLPIEYPKEDTSAPKNWRETKDVNQFCQFLDDELGRIGNPTSMRTLTEKERGLGQYKQLNKYISDALRHDYDGILDIDRVDKTRSQVENYIDTIENTIDGVNKMKHQRKRMRRRAEDENELIKEANTPNFNGIQINISPFERAIVGLLINGTVSGGRDMEELYQEVKKKYEISNREELAIFQILADMGYPTFKDRLKISDEQDPTREKDFGEWQSQYYA